MGKINKLMHTGNAAEDKNLYLLLAILCLWLFVIKGVQILSRKTETKQTTAEPVSTEQESETGKQSGIRGYVQNNLQGRSYTA